MSCQTQILTDLIGFVDVASKVMLIPCPIHGSYGSIVKEMLLKLATPPVYTASPFIPQTGVLVGVGGGGVGVSVGTVVVVLVGVFVGVGVDVTGVPVELGVLVGVGVDVPGGTVDVLVGVPVTGIVGVGV